jgi:hypothetical protein
MDREEVIYRTCIAWAERAWLRVKRRGMIDPVIELWAMDKTDPDRVLVLAAERGELARRLDAHCPGAADALEAATPDHPFTVLIAAPSGAKVYHLPAPDGRAAGAHRIARRRGRE